MTDHSLFIGAAYGLSALGLLVLATKTYIDMKRTAREAGTLRKLRRETGEET